MIRSLSDAGKLVIAILHDMDFVADQLKRIGYKGDITCEVVIHDISNEEFPEKLKFICDRAGEIREKIL